MKRYKLTIAYDGTAYNGWQRQSEAPGVNTVQREVEKAAGSIVSHPCIVLGSSRTDTGVHALGQVAAMNIDSHLDPAPPPQSHQLLPPPRHPHPRPGRSLPRL